MYSKLIAMCSSLAILLSAQTAALAEKGGAQSIDSDVQNAIADLDKNAQHLIDTNTIPGVAVGVVYKDKVLFAKGYGVREVGKPDKVDADTVFQLASVSKPISSTVIAELVGEGRIQWDSKISDLDPSFEMFDSWVTRELTIRDLYCHRSGLPDHACDLLEDIGYNRGQVLHRLRFQKPDSSFRSHYAYTNFGITEGAVAAARAVGLTWEEAAEQRLFKPLGMNSTSARYADFIDRSDKALNHVLVDGKWVHKYQRQPDAQSPAGGVSSSVNDMNRWLRLQLNKGKFEGKQLVDEKALVETRSPQMLTMFSPLDGHPCFYGLGMDLNYDERGRLRLGHSGGFALGESTYIGMVPSEELGVVVLINGYPVGATEGLAFTFLDSALHKGKLSQDWFAIFKNVYANPATLGLVKGFDYSKPAAKATPASPDSAYVGTYKNELFGPILITDHDGHLTMQCGPNQKSFPITHYDRDVFTFQTEGENACGTSGLIFTVGPDSKASMVVVEAFNENGQGKFKRVEDKK